MDVFTYLFPKFHGNNFQSCCFCGGASFEQPFLFFTLLRKIRPSTRYVSVLSVLLSANIQTNLRLCQYLYAWICTYINIYIYIYIGSIFIQSLSRKTRMICVVYNYERTYKHMLCQMYANCIWRKPVHAHSFLHSVCNSMYEYWRHDRNI